MSLDNREEWGNLLNAVHQTLSDEVNRAAIMAGIPWHRAVCVKYGPNSKYTRTYAKLVCEADITTDFSLHPQCVVDLEEYITNHPEEFADGLPLVYKFELFPNEKFEYSFGYSGDDEVQAIQELEILDANHRSLRKADYKRIRDQFTK